MYIITKLIIHITFCFIDSYEKVCTRSYIYEKGRVTDAFLQNATNTHTHIYMHGLMHATCNIHFERKEKTTPNTQFRYSPHRIHTQNEITFHAHDVYNSTVKKKKKNIFRRKGQTTVQETVYTCM